MIDVNKENFAITKVGSEDIEIICIYRSQDGNMSHIIENLRSLINWSTTTIVIGDINICNKDKPDNEMKKILTDREFKLVISAPTHILGGHIDHAYILNVGNYVESPIVEIIPKYYSDHDAICIAWRKINLSN